MPGPLIDLLVPLAGAALVVAAGTLLLRRSPRLALVVWLVVLCFVPVWAGSDLGLPQEPQVAATLGLLVALLSLRGSLPVRLTVVDLLVMGFVVSALLPVLTGWGTSRELDVLVLRWAGAYALGRVVGRRVRPEHVYTAVAVCFTVVAALTLLEWLTDWNPFLLVPGEGPLADTWAWIQERGGVARAEGAFGHSIALGGSLALAVPMVLVSPLRVPVRMAMVVLLGAASAVTFSRIGLGTLTLGLLLVVVFLRTGLSRRMRALVAGGLVAGAAAAAPLVSTVFEAAGDEATGSADYRSDLLDLLGQVRPLGLSPSYFLAATGESSFGTFRSIDNALLLAGLNYGWIPLLFVLAALAVAVGAVLRRRATAATIAVVAQLPALGTVALITQYASWLWFVAGLAVATQVLATAGRPDGDLREDAPGPVPEERREPSLLVGSRGEIGRRGHYRSDEA
ncbi:hypothetical protein [Blastococcus sp. TF02A-26]|uniref:hypothetical protein n=1 Tax=Blastococcus sp. TF02A-26 TaxID=2250577 RepID=UPI000DEA91B0|nr:hypothetical protein [Blastococcus sp. TF02A-26]RBY86139.1 hypothetical protein DQ240_10050 [Blastococcus sp. TF02A-26]